MHIVSNFSQRDHEEFVSKGFKYIDGDFKGNLIEYQLSISMCKVLYK